MAENGASKGYLGKAFGVAGGALSFGRKWFLAASGLALLDMLVDGSEPLKKVMEVIEKPDMSTIEKVWESFILVNGSALNGLGDAAKLLNNSISFINDIYQEKALGFSPAP